MSVDAKKGINFDRTPSKTLKELKPIIQKIQTKSLNNSFVETVSTNVPQSTHNLVNHQNSSLFNVQQAQPTFQQNFNGYNNFNNNNNNFDPNSTFLTNNLNITNTNLTGHPSTSTPN